MAEYAKKTVTLPELVFNLPDVVRDLPKILTALYYNYSITPDSYVSVGDLFLKTVHKYPHRPCIYYQDESWTYAEFNDWVNRLANRFLEMGFRKGDVVAVLLENRPEILAITMAMAKIGGVAALINTSQKHQSLIHSFKLANPKLVLIGAELASHYKEIEKEADIPKEMVFALRHPEHKPAKQGWKWFDIECKTYSPQEPKFRDKIRSRDACMYIYTSGTTGLPKASVISHGRWIKGYSAFGLTGIRLNPEDILYVPLPFFHATAMVVCWTSVVAGGASMVIKKKFSVTDFWTDIDRHQATAFGYVGEMCKYLLNAPKHPLEHNNTLKKMIGNGLRPDIWQIFKERFGIEQIAEFYASSEGNIAFFNLFNIDATMGFSITSYAIVEYDDQKGQPVRDRRGYMKKVKANGTGLLLGEINERYPFDGYTEKNQTEKAIFRNVFKKGDAWFNTGDLVRDMGFFHTQFVDRLGDTFRWKGENVSTTEVEGILNRFPGIAESIVYGVQIADNSGRAGMANLILEDGLKNFPFDDFYSYVKRELPPYAVPLFLRLSKQTETTSTFKYKKHALKEEAYDPDKAGKEVFALIKGEYTRISKKLCDEINAGKHRF